MFVCLDCERKFFDPKVIFLKNSILPPYEKKTLCPYCESENITYMEARHCKCCGARLPYNSNKDYCSISCKRRGEKLRAIEAKRRKERNESAIYKTVREMIEYNKQNGKNLSYGEFTALKLKGEN